MLIFEIEVAYVSNLAHPWLVAFVVKNRNCRGGILTWSVFYLSMDFLPSLMF